MLAFALRADGWYLRSDIIWAKGNPMPESVEDRPTKSHEYIFLLTKQPVYFYDHEAIKEPSAEPGRVRNDPVGGASWEGRQQHDQGGVVSGATTRNKRTVWNVNTRPFPGSHFAVFPEDLIEPCILAGTSAAGCCAACGRAVERAAMVLERSDRTHTLGRTRTSGTMLSPPTSRTVGWEPACDCGADLVPCRVLDPFGGSGTTAAVARKLGRHATICELNPEYVDMAHDRIGLAERPQTYRNNKTEDAPLFDADYEREMEMRGDPNDERQGAQ
jgi:hypothetical protein